MISRRKILAGLALSTAAGLTAMQNAVAAPAIPMTELRGSIDAGAAGLRPERGRDQTSRLMELIADAARNDQWLFLPPGRYEVANLTLPDRTRLTGIAGATEIVFIGGGSFIRGENAGRIELSNLVFDGADMPLADGVPALLHMRGITDLTLENCALKGCERTALQMERCGGRIARCDVSAIGEFGIYALDSAGLTIVSNRIDRCGNGGILVHRNEKGEDGSIVSGNRITRTGATYGGTGQFGNAINIYRADAVSVSGNHVSDSAFTAIRANAASNIRIADNTCLRSGETAIYSEFGFEGALVTGNLVDGAANGISIANFNEGGRLAVVSGNIVRNISLTGLYVHDSVGFGIGIGVEADTVVSNNVIENVPRWGMLIGWGPFLRNVSVTGNVIRGARIGCAVTVAEQPGAALISGNVFDRTPDGAIVGFRWHDAATRDLAEADAESFPHLTITGNRVT